MTTLPFFFLFMVYNDVCVHIQIIFLTPELEYNYQVRANFARHLANIVNSKRNAKICYFLID